MGLVVVVDSDLQVLIPKFIARQTETVATLRAALAQRDYRELAQQGHKMKGASGGYGFFELGRIAEELEEAAKLHNYKALSQNIEAIADYLTAVKVEYREGGG